MGYKGPNGIPKDVPERAWTVLLVALTADLEYETVTHGNLYNFAIWNNPVTRHREIDHKSQLVKPILMKPMVLDQGHVKLPECIISDIQEQ